MGGKIKVFIDRWVDWTRDPVDSRRDFSQQIVLVEKGIKLWLLQQQK